MIDLNNRTTNNDVFQKGINKLTLKKKRKKTYIGVELADETRKVVVLEVIRKQILSKLSGFPDNKRRTAFVPRYYIVGYRIIHQLISLGQERRRHRPLRHLSLTHTNPGPTEVKQTIKKIK